MSLDPTLIVADPMCAQGLAFETLNFVALLIGKCDPKTQPTRETVDLFLGLLGFLKTKNPDEAMVEDMEQLRRDIQTLQKAISLSKIRGVS